MVRGFAARVKPARGVPGRKRTAKGTLLLSDMGLTNVTEKSRMRRAAMRVVLPGLAQAQLPVHGKAHLGGIAVLLAIVLPPADRTQAHDTRSVERLVSTAGASIARRDSFHT